jgi:hypothetical protein
MEPQFLRSHPKSITVGMLMALLRIFFRGKQATVESSFCFFLCLFVLVLVLPVMEHALLGKLSWMFFVASSGLFGWLDVGLPVMMEQAPEGRYM